MTQPACIIQTESGGTENSAGMCGSAGQYSLGRFSGWVLTQHAEYQVISFREGFLFHKRRIALQRDDLIPKKLCGHWDQVCK